MRTGLGNVLLAVGGSALLAGVFGVHAGAGWAESCAAVGVALLTTGGGVCGSGTAVGRRWVGYAALLVFIPCLFALLLMAWLHWGTQFPLRVASEVWLELGLATACAAALALLAVERAVRPVDQHERVLVDLGLGLGYAELALLKRRRRGAQAAASAAWVVIFPCLAVVYGGLPPLQVVPLLGFAWAIQQTTLILHELGHALYGLALGYRVRRLVVGGAPKLATFNVGSASVELGLRPSHGLVEFDFGAVPVWVGLRRVAWAGPTTGLIPLAAGIVGEVVYIHSRFAFFAFSLLVVYGLSSCAQLIPDRIRLGNRPAYSDGVWLFFPEAIVKHTLVVSNLAPLLVGAAVSNSAQLMMPRFVELYQRLRAEPETAQRLALLDALARTPPDNAALEESPMCELFLFGCLFRLSRAVNDAAGLEPAMDRFLAGSTPPLFKARALDLLACSLLFPPVQAQLALAERSARRALMLFPNDPTLHGTLGTALVELGQTGEACTHLLYLLKHSLQRSDRRLARKYLKRCGG